MIKIYIGKHCASEFEPDNYIGSGKLLHKAIKKYGKANFKNELICWCFSKEELNEKEKYYVALHKNKSDVVIYNISPGGDGNFPGSMVINNGISDLFIKPEDFEYYEKLGYVKGRNMSKYVNGMVGHKQSEKQKAAASKACSYKRTPEQKQNFSAAKKVPDKFVCLRTPDNHSTIRCLLKNKEKYLSLGYLECKDKPKI